MSGSKMALLATVAISVSTVSLWSATVPDIPTGSKIFIENKGTSDEAARFAELLAEKLGREDGGRNYNKPGFPVVEKKEDADFVLRVLPVLRHEDAGMATKAGNHARVTVWLLDAKGSRLWAHDYDCMASFREPMRECYQHISDDLKSAQVNAEGKRAGFLGWKKH